MLFSYIALLQGITVSQSLSVKHSLKASPKLFKGFQSPGVQLEGKHWPVHHVQGEHYPRKVLRVRVILSALVGNPESFPVQRICRKSKFKIPGLVPNYRSDLISFIVKKIHKL